MTPQTLRRIPDPFLVLRRVLVSGPITALAKKKALPKNKHCLGARLHFVGGAGQALALDARRVRKEGPQGRNGSVTPLALRRRGTISKPLG